MVATAKMGGSLGGRTVGRKRTQEPSRITTQGQLLHYLAHLIDQSDLTVDDIAPKLGVDRTTVFRWLAGRGSGPTFAHLDAIARMLGKADAWALKPTKRFLDTL